jgi:hypothetical protein
LAAMGIVVYLQQVKQKDVFNDFLYESLKINRESRRLMPAFFGLEISLFLFGGIESF